MQIKLTEHAVQLQTDYNNKFSFIPSNATSKSAGYDVRACISGNVRLSAGQHALVPLGFHAWIKDKSKAALLIPKSGLSLQNFGIKNHAGLIDADYQEEWAALVWHTGHVKTGHSQDIVITPGMKIAQIIFIDVNHPVLELVEEFDGTTNRFGGFGSTDTVHEGSGNVFQDLGKENAKELKELARESATAEEFKAKVESTSKGKK